MSGDGRRIQSRPVFHRHATISGYSELGHALDESKIGSTSKKEVSVSFQRRQTDDGVLHRGIAPAEVTHAVHSPLTWTSGDHKSRSDGPEAWIKESDARDEPKPMAGRQADDGVHTHGAVVHDYSADLEAATGNERLKHFFDQFKQPEVSRPSPSQTINMIIVPQKPYKSRTPFEPFDLWPFDPDRNAFIRLSAALKGEVNGSGFHEPVYQGDISEKASIRIEWPGYEPYTKQVNIRRTSEKVTQSITIIKFIQEIAKQVQNMIKEFAGVKCTEPEWDLSLRGSITFDQIVLLKVIQVSAGSFQPILAVARQNH